MAKEPIWELTGDKDLERLLRKLPTKVQTQVMRSALKFAAKRPVKDYQASLERVGLGFATEHIIAKFKSYARSGNSIAVIGAVGKVEYKGQRVAKILAIDEYGWTKRGQGPGSRPPRPTLRRVFARMESYMLSEFKKALGNKIFLAARRLAKR